MSDLGEAVPSLEVRFREEELHQLTMWTGKCWNAGTTPMRSSDLRDVGISVEGGKVLGVGDRFDGGRSSRLPGFGCGFAAGTMELAFHHGLERHSDRLAHRSIHRNNNLFGEANRASGNEEPEVTVNRSCYLKFAPRSCYVCRAQSSDHHKQEVELHITRFYNGAPPNTPAAQRALRRRAD